MTQLSSVDSDVDDKSIRDNDTYTESVAASSYVADMPERTIPATVPRIASLSPGTNVSSAGPTLALPSSRSSQDYHHRRRGRSSVAANRFSDPKNLNELDDSFVNDFSEWLAPESWSANPEHNIERVNSQPSQPSDPWKLNNPTRFQDEPQPWKTGNRKSFSDWCNEDTFIVPPRRRPILIPPPASLSPPPPELPSKKETYRNDRTKDNKPYPGIENWAPEDYDPDDSKHPDEKLGNWGVGWEVPRYNKNIVPPRRRPIVTRSPASPSPPPSELPPKKETYLNRNHTKPYLSNGGWDVPGKDYGLDDSKYSDGLGAWGTGWDVPRKHHDLDNKTYSDKGWGVPHRDPSPRKKNLRFKDEGVDYNYDDDFSYDRGTKNKWGKATIRRSPSPSPVREKGFFIPPLFGNPKGYYLQFHELLRPGSNKLDWNVTSDPYQFAYCRDGSHVKPLPLDMELLPATQPPITGMCLIMDEVTRYVRVETFGARGSFVSIGMVMWNIYRQLVTEPIAAEDWFDLADGKYYPHRMKAIASKKRAERRDNPRAPPLKWGDMLGKKVYFGGIVDFVEKPLHGGNLPTFIVNFEE